MSLSRPPIRSLLTLLLAASLLTGCFVHQHRVGNGAAGIDEVHTREYYLFFGLMRINEVDTQRYAQDAVSYDVTTKFGFTDILITALLGPLSVTSRSITIER